MSSVIVPSQPPALAGWKAASFCRNETPPPRSAYRRGTRRQLVDSQWRGRGPGGKSFAGTPPVRLLSSRPPGHLVKLWARRGGASTPLASVLGSSAGDVAACATAVLASVLGSSAANGDVAACRKTWVRAHSDVRRRRPDL